jgi:hypothetical protein
MEQILNILGFTDSINTAWSLLGYAGMILITIAVISAKWQKPFFFWGPLVLLVYATHLNDFILMGLQTIITASGLLNLLNIKKKSTQIVLALTVAVYAILLATGKIYGIHWVGSFGLLGIAIGMTQLPLKRGFTIMSIGGLLVVVYSFALQVWIFFILNIVFFIANILSIKSYKATS